MFNLHPYIAAHLSDAIGPLGLAPAESAFTVGGPAAQDAAAGPLRDAGSLARAANTKRERDAADLDKIRAVRRRRLNTSG